MKINRKGIYLVLILILAAAAAFLIKGGPDRLTRKISTGEINPFYGNIETSISTTGTVKPQNRLEIKPPIAGRIEEILVKEGQRVKTGEVLALMSSTERAALLDAAYLKGGELEYWKEVYKATPLVAPIDAEVIVRAVEPGQTVSAADVILVLSDRLIVKAQFDETDIGKVKLGQDAAVSLDAYPNVKVKARVDHISYESEIVNNVTIYEVDLLPEAIPDVFRSGMSANVEVIEQSKAKALLLPLEAIKRQQDSAFVLLSRGKQSPPLKQKVTLGISNGINVEVISGLKPGDKVIVETEKYVPAQDTPSGGSPFMPFGRRRPKQK